MRNSTAQASATLARPEKPFPEFPLSPHSSGKWQKKHKGKIYYFGAWARREKGELVRVEGDGWEAALREYQDWEKYRKPYLGGKEPEPQPEPEPEGLTLFDVYAQYLEAKSAEVDTGDIQMRTYRDYKETAKKVLEVFGGERLVDSLKPNDFRKLNAEFAKTHSQGRRAKDITQTKMIFNWALSEGLIDRMPAFGSGFKRPSKDKIELEKQEGGKKLFTADEIQRLIDHADATMTAMILLGVNCALGNADVNNLKLRHIDLDTGWLDYPRPKNGRMRRCPLWPETIDALRAVIAKRPKAKLAEDEQVVFLTPSGDRYIRVTGKSRSDYVSQQFGALLRELKINGRRNLGFYSLRRTHTSIALQTFDRDAAKFIMGHSSHEMIDTYNQLAPSDDRLKAVVAYVHDWLYPPDIDSAHREDEEGGDA